MKSLKEEFPHEVKRLEVKHAGRFIELSEIRDLITPETPARVVGGNIQFLLHGEWVRGSRTDLFDGVWTHCIVHEAGLEWVKDFWTKANWYGAILSERDGLIVIDSMTDG